jgi:sortase A
MALGLGVLIWGGVTMWWGDPVTWVWAHWEQRGLTSEFHQVEQRYVRQIPPADDTAALAAVGRAARDFAGRDKSGHAFGRITISRIGISHVVVVQGTSSGVLKKGPGHYPNTPFPGLDGTVGIAGHRTTFGAWFRHIDEIRSGDVIRVQMPYATFQYRVEGHKIVDDQDWSIIKGLGYERLVLSACHPLYNASQRFVVFARAVSVTPAGDDSRIIKL